MKRLSSIPKNSISQAPTASIARVDNQIVTKRPRAVQVKHYIDTTAVKVDVNRVTTNRLRSVQRFSILQVHANCHSDTNFNSGAKTTSTPIDLSLFPAGHPRLEPKALDLTTDQAPSTYPNNERID